MINLREKLFGKRQPLRERLATIGEPVKNATDVELLKDKKTITENPVTVEDNALVPNKTPKTVQSKKTDISFIGTNYDPYDPDQTRENPDGKGAAGVVMDDSMVATALKEDGMTGNLRLGTVIKVPSLGNKLFLVSDLMNKRFNGQNKIDFVRKNKKKEPDPEVNKEFEDIEIVREGNGREDVRKFIESGEWEKMQKENNEN